MGEVFPLRPFSCADDLDLCTTAEHAAYRDAFGIETSIQRVAADVEKIRVRIERGDYWGFTATEGTRPIGLVLIDRLDPDGLYVHNLYVEPDFRRRGVARALMDRVVEWGSELGCRRIELTVTATNDAAVKLYQSLGYAIARYRMRLNTGQD